MAKRKQPSGKDALVQAVEILGGQAQLARAMSEQAGRAISQQWLWSVLRRNKPVPAEFCLPAEAATSGKVTRHQLRPDLYPAEQSAQPVRAA